ncbi:unnamed protein product [Caenorhabditis angaria]|uniref:Uncharacterized protein n=1 Tax=Caenorhabditis angaria TaxID=860376 RepID=A0A9P1ITE3_9PELO|nr:unnamed protein product [Caenorhabditis angaria]
METRRVRVPSARMLAAKQDEEFTFKSVVEAPKIPPQTLSSALKAAEIALQPNLSTTTVIEERIDEGKVEQIVEETVETEKLIDSQEELIDVGNPKYDKMTPDPTDIGQTIKVEGENDLMGDVGAEVTIESQRNRTPHVRRSGGISGGETLSLKSSDLSIPNKAAHFLYFRCYDEHEVQKEFPLTIDCNKKGVQNFLVEPRVGLRNTDYYIDSYLWNRGKSTSSKKKIFVEVEGNHVKTSRKCLDTAPYILNWYYSNMENRITKKVCWLETCPDGVRASPVLVQYYVNYISEIPIETVARFIETGETDPREIINKKQAYEMRRYVFNTRRKKHKREELIDLDGNPIFFDDPNGDIYEETVYYDENGMQQSSIRRREVSESARIANSAVKMVARKLENRISALLDNRLGLCPSKMLVRVPMMHNPDLQGQADQLGEWINSLTSSTSDDVDIVINNVVGQMRKQLDEICGADGSELTEYVEEAGTSHAKYMQEPPSKRRREHVEPKQESFADQQAEYLYDGGNMEYVEEEVITEDIVANSIQGPREVVVEQRNVPDDSHRQSRPYYYQDNSDSGAETPRDMSITNGDLNVEP